MNIKQYLSDNNFRHSKSCYTNPLITDDLVICVLDPQSFCINSRTSSNSFFYKKEKPVELLKHFCLFDKPNRDVVINRIKNILGLQDYTLVSSQTKNLLARLLHIEKDHVFSFIRNYKVVGTDETLIHNIEVVLDDKEPYILFKLLEDTPDKELLIACNVSSNREIKDKLSESDLYVESERVGVFNCV